MDACTNPEILKVIYFFMIIVDIVKIVIPIILIILGIIDFSKSVVISDEKAQKKSLNLFLKRLLYGILVFTVPWIVEVLAITLGNFGEPDAVNFTDCLENANSECIESLETNDSSGIKKYCDSKKEEKYCWQCNDNSNLYNWGTSASNSNCKSGWHKITKKQEDCGVKKCYQCNNNQSLVKWSINTPTEYCPAGWHTTNINEENCK